MSQGKKLKIIWLTWEKQNRNRSMSKELGVPLFEVLTERSRYIRYMSCISRTLAILWSEKPNIVICQNPSVVLTLFLLGIRPFLSLRVVIDAHYGGIDSWTGCKVFQKVLNFCNRVADLVIVTNKNHAHKVYSMGGKAFICPDPLPNLKEDSKHETIMPRKIFFICSFEIDEPFHEVFKAADILAREGYHFFVSGNYRKGGIAPGDFPHVIFLGFVPDREFYSHLFSSEIVIDLTENENCLVCGAYEALEAGKPLVLSKKKALEEYFTGGTVFTENHATEIAKAVRHAYAERLKLIADSRQWVFQEKNNTKNRIANLQIMLERI